jgi:hypothetical protein
LRADDITIHRAIPMTPPISADSFVRMSSRQQRRLHARRSRMSAARLGGYLAAGMGAGFLGVPQADAAVVPINIGPTGFNIDGINANVNLGQNGFRYILNFPTTGAGMLSIYANSTGFGFVGSGLSIAAGSSNASPTNVSLGQTINGSLSFPQSFYNTMFRGGGSSSPDFGSGSYLAFRTAQNSYGWLETTWSSSSSQFYILSGAYESTPNTPIGAGVPEPSTAAAVGVAALAIGAGAIRRARKARSATVTSA